MHSLATPLNSRPAPASRRNSVPHCCPRPQGLPVRCKPPSPRLSRSPPPLGGCCCLWRSPSSSPSLRRSYEKRLCTTRPRSAKSKTRPCADTGSPRQTATPARCSTASCSSRRYTSGHRPADVPGSCSASSQTPLLHTRSCSPPAGCPSMGPPSRWSCRASSLSQSSPAALP